MHLHFIATCYLSGCYISWCRYPYNNALHHHVESIIYSCLESKNNAIVDHILQECNLIGKILQTEKNPTLSGELNEVDEWHFLDFSSHCHAVACCDPFFVEQGAVGMRTFENLKIKIANDAVQGWGNFSSILSTSIVFVKWNSYLGRIWCSCSLPYPSWLELKLCNNVFH